MGNIFQFLGPGQDVSAALYGVYDIPMVLLSVFVAFVASFAGLRLSGQSGRAESMAGQMVWVFPGALSIGGGVWTMHCLGMLAFSLPANISFNLIYIVLSIVPGLMGALAALWVTVRDGVSVNRLFVGGGLLGLGVSATHYLGMAAVQFDGEVFYSPWVIALSIGFTIVLSILGLGARPIIQGQAVSLSNWGYSLIGGAFLGAAMVSMHYFGMEGAYFLTSGNETAQMAGISPQTLAIGVAVAFVVMTALTLSVSVLARYMMTTQILAEEIEKGKAAQDDISRLTKAVEQSPATVLITDTDGCIEYVNPKFTEITGYDAVEVIGKKPSLLSSGYTSQEEYKALWKTIVSGQEWRGEFKNRKKDGTFYWETATISPIKSEDGVITHFLSVKEDVTHHKKDEETLRERNRMIELLQRVAVIANEAEDVDQAMQQCLNLVCDFTGWPVGHVLKLDPVNADLCSANIWSLNPANEFENFRAITDAARFPKGVGLPGRVLESGEPAWITDVTKDPNFPRAKEGVDIGLRAGFAFPIEAGGQTVAVMEFFSKEPREPLSNIFEVMAHIGAQIGQAMERAKVQENLANNEEKLRSIMNASNVTAIVSIDSEGQLATWNPGAEATFGYSEGEIIGQPLTLLIPERFREAHAAGLERALQGNDYKVIGKTVELSGLRKSGREFPLELSLGVWEQDGKKYFSGIINDITERKQAEKRINQLAYTDTFTGIPNETYFIEQLTAATDESRRGFVATIELSGIGDIVGTFGLEASELIIYETSRRLTEFTKDHGVAARAGARLFKVLYLANDQEGERRQKAAAERLYQVVRSPFDLMGSNIFVNVYMGVSIIDPDESTTKTILTDVEMAHHEANKLESGGLVYFDDMIKETLVRNTQVVSWLHTAIENRDFQLFYQPQVDLRTNTIIGCEALVRWQRETGEWISPGEFIPIAEKSGLIEDITTWTVEEACRTAVSWLETFDVRMRVGVNISAEELASPDFVKYVCRFIDKTNVPPELLEFEITETALMKDVNVASRNLKILREMDSTVAVDDFGTGQASLAYLKTFPIDRLKIDQSFVKSAPESKADQEIIATIVKLAHSLGMDVIAEGAEEKGHIDLLMSLGCDEVQGYFIGKPMPADQFIDFLRDYG